MRAQTVVVHVVPPPPDPAPQSSTRKPRAESSADAEKE
jgi:hypothetical protein